MTFASESHTKPVSQYVELDLTVNGRVYEKVKLKLMDNLCADIILGNVFQEKHESVVFKFGGPLPPLEVCGLSTLNVDPPAPFENLTSDCTPIATKSRRYSKPDQLFIRSEVRNLLNEGIIQPSKSPWRAQVVVTREEENHKKRLVVDYSQTINKYTQLDAYPVPRMDDFINKVAQYRVFTSIDLKSAYHQIPLREEDRPLTAFEADGGLWEFTRLSPGVTNGGSCFQRCVDNMIEKEGVPDTFAYFDNIYICGHDDEHHDRNLAKFNDVSKEYNLTVNTKKTTFKTRRLEILGSIVQNGTIRPDPERLRPLREMPSPRTPKALKRVLGMFSHYSRWIPQFSDKIAPLLNVETFPLPSRAEQAFQELKIAVENSVVTAIDESLPFEVETDASDIALAAVLSQGGRPVAFFSRTLHGSERQWPPVEKEACAIIEAVRNWKHFLTGRKFTLRTDQEAVSYIFEAKHKGKIKNEKLFRWRLELSCYTYDIFYRPGKDNVVADTFSRAYCSVVNSDSLYELHNALCHPGVTRMTAFVRSRNLPYSVEDIRKVNAGCRICAECKPRFFEPPNKGKLIKATQPFERLNLDFKGPLPATSKNKYILTVVDEYSRYPFAIPCADVSAATVFKECCHLFSIFGVPSYVHSDRGSGFMSNTLRKSFQDKGIACSRTTPYHPQGNGLVERYNGTIWKTITLCLKSHKLPTTKWELVVPEALHAIRSLINTTTNCTPHERIFNFQRRTSTGFSLPSWLASPGKVLLRRFVRRSKYDPLVDEVDLIEANPSYAYIRYPDGRESSVNIRDLAPCGEVVEESAAVEETVNVESPSEQGVVSERAESVPTPAEPSPAPSSEVQPLPALSSELQSLPAPSSELYVPPPRRSGRSNHGLPRERLIQSCAMCQK